MRVPDVIEEVPPVSEANEVEHGAVTVLLVDKCRIQETSYKPGVIREDMCLT
jgi:hypothetical protein